MSDLEAVARAIDGRGWDDDCTAKPETKEALRKWALAIAPRVIAILAARGWKKDGD